MVRVLYSETLNQRATIAVLILELSRRRALYNKWQIYRWAQYFRPYLMTWKNLVQWPLNPDIRAATGKRGPPPLQIGLSGQKGLFLGKEQHGSENRWNQPLEFALKLFWTAEAKGRWFCNFYKGCCSFIFLQIVLKCKGLLWRPLTVNWGTTLANLDFSFSKKMENFNE